MPRPVPRPALVALLLAGTAPAAFPADAPEVPQQPAETSSQAPPTQLPHRPGLVDVGLDLFGYFRTGAYGAANGEAKGQYQLGGPLDHYRLGNEGDTYLEFGIGKKFGPEGGVRWGVYAMPTLYDGRTGTAQAYADVTGLRVAPGASFWIGQRYHRVQDVHILDNWMMQDGDDVGLGMDDLDLHAGKLNVALYGDGSADTHDSTPAHARRLGVQWRGIPSNAHGKLTLTGALVHGAFGEGGQGAALGALHNQDFGPDVDNSLFLQWSRGHADITGEFYGLPDQDGTPHAGARQWRVVDALGWQAARFGGQAVVGVQTISPDAAVSTRDFSTGARLSWGLARRVKLLGELGFNRLETAGQAPQHLHKATLAVALSPDDKFWTRPELRAYITRANWDEAAGLANAATFGQDGRRAATAFGLQLETWWN